MAARFKKAFLSLSNTGHETAAHTARRFVVSVPSSSPSRSRFRLVEGWRQEKERNVQRKLLVSLKLSVSQYARGKFGAFHLKLLVPRITATCMATMRLGLRYAYRTGIPLPL